jgi:MoaE-MoaD fusion protein
VQVNVRLFASYREAAGVGHLQLNLPPGSRVRDAIAEIAKRHPLITEGRRVVIAKNRDYVTADEPLADGDEVALIPPVSGGETTISAAAGRKSIPLVQISEGRLSVDDAIAAASDSRWGGIVVFLGTVRDASRGKRVTHLEYEAYAEMAEAKMREIAAALERKHAPCRVVLHHRIGDLAIGEIAVIVVAGAPHRDAAFKAAREAIDELKTVVPIWKKEYSEDGAVWIEEHA